MIGTIIRKEIVLVLKDKGTFFWLIVLPILFIVIFASIFGKQETATYSIPYYDADGTKQSQQLVEMLGQVKGFELKLDEENTLEEQLKGVKDGTQTYLLVIPKGYGNKVGGKESTELELYRDVTAEEAVAPVMALLDSISSSFQEHKLRGILLEMGQSETVVDAMMAPPVQVKEIKENAAKADPITQIVPGYTVMFVFFIMINMITNFLKDRQSGMLTRLQGTPMKPLHYLLGMWIPHILILLIQSTILLGFGRLVYGLNVGNLLAIALIALALAVCATGIGLMLALLVSSENTGIAIVQVIALGGAIVAGLWFPYDFLPKILQTIGKFTPQYWAQKGMQDVMIRGADVTDIGITLFVLFGFGLVGLTVALLRFKRFALKTV
ncbi:ABC transporter permease [Paenibacillus sp. L3-i20]|uniref:ABC transporter permease n=1 Tax=Paenibacillus sp. L3-i20 TaxID=2905833 RepID=UPI001EDCD2A9|nr:ABC transporter permease [Paenibacillus sp. L3-i20]GKU77515.1 hypothetical protein L3i20_v219120 [Paenibacillus sp. L3-i20]